MLRGGGQHRAGLGAWGVGTIVAVVLWTLAGCGEDSKPEKASSSAEPLRRTARLDPVTVTVTVEPVPVDANRPALALVQVEAERNVSIADPGYEHALAEGDRPFQYRVTGVKRTGPERTAAGGTRWTYRYDVEFFVPGEYELPGVKLSFAEERGSSQSEPAADAESNAQSEVPVQKTVETEALQVTVAAGGAAASPEDLRSVQRLEPLELPLPWERWGWLMAAVAATGAVAAWLLWSRRRRDLLLAEPPIAAHEWARRELAALLADDLIGQRLVQEFFYRISGIVRGYVERRFGIAAPEMTTEEFLTAAADNGRLNYIGKAPLREFLSSCDLVKYARHEPGQPECEGAFRAAVEFVEQTRERPAEKEAIATSQSLVEMEAA